MQDLSTSASICMCLRPSFCQHPLIVRVNLLKRSTVQASFYPGAFQCPASDPNAQYSAPNLTTIAPDHRFDRCQDALDYTVSLRIVTQRQELHRKRELCIISIRLKQMCHVRGQRSICFLLSCSYHCSSSQSMQVPNTTFPSVPPLPDSLFSSCYAAKLEGYVRVDNYTDLQFLTPEPVPKFYNSYRCFAALRHTACIIAIYTSMLLQKRTSLVFNYLAFLYNGRV